MCGWLRILRDRARVRARLVKFHCFYIAWISTLYPLPSPPPLPPAAKTTMRKFINMHDKPKKLSPWFQSSEFYGKYTRGYFLIFCYKLIIFLFHIMNMILSFNNYLYHWMKFNYKEIWITNYKHRHDQVNTVDYLSWFIRNVYSSSFFNSSLS